MNIKEFKDNSFEVFKRMFNKMKEGTLVEQIKSAFKGLLSLNETSSRITILGRSIERPESLFEIMLSIYGISNVNEKDEICLMEQIWKKFELFRTPEIINIVSIIYDIT